MKVLVTGAFGWTARSVLETLRDNGHKITAFDNGADCPAEVSSLATEIVRGDVRNHDDLSRALSGADAAVHMAVLSGEQAYEVAEPAFSANVLGTYNLFEAGRRQNVERVVLISEALVHLPVG